MKRVGWRLRKKYRLRQEANERLELVKPKKERVDTARLAITAAAEEYIHYLRTL